MPHVYKTVRAEQDLEDIRVYIPSDSPEAANRWLDVLLEKARSLAERYQLGRARPELLPDLAPDLRSFPVQAYVLFYRPVDDGIELVRVLHSSRDLGNAFSETQR